MFLQIVGYRPWEIIQTWGELQPDWYWTVSHLGEIQEEKQCVLCLFDMSLCIPNFKLKTYRECFVVLHPDTIFIEGNFNYFEKFISSKFWITPLAQSLYLKKNEVWKWKKTLQWYRDNCSIQIARDGQAPFGSRTGSAIISIQFNLIFWLT